MKTVSQDNSSSSDTETKSAELVLLLDGLRIDPAVLAQSHEVLNEPSSTLNDGVRARIRLRNNSETLRSLVHPRTLRVSRLTTLHFF